MTIFLLLSLYINIATSIKVDYSSIITSLGDRLPDFSFCGYHSADRNLPNIDSNVTQVLSPSSGDQTTRVQNALDQISQTGGGVLLLSPGSYKFNSSLIIPNATVLRGSGAGKTILLPQSASSVFITLGTGSGAPEVSPVTNITDEYVPIGVSSFNVADASKFSVGQSIIVQRAVTEEWIRANGMADLEKDGEAQTWIPVS
jgi:hypothetical protein